MDPRAGRRRDARAAVSDAARWGGTLIERAFDYRGCLECLE
jgi:hypothetical protein